MAKGIAISVTLASFSLAMGCQSTVGSAPTSGSEAQAEATIDTRKPISVTRALELFESICVETAPLHLNVEDVAKAEGLSQRNTRFGFASLNEMVGVGVERPSARNRRCTLEFVTSGGQTETLLSRFTDRFQTAELEQGVMTMPSIHHRSVSLSGAGEPTTTARYSAITNDPQERQFRFIIFTDE